MIEMLALRHAFGHIVDAFEALAQAATTSGMATITLPFTYQQLSDDEQRRRAMSRSLTFNFDSRQLVQALLTCSLLGAFVIVVFAIEGHQKKAEGIEIIFLLCGNRVRPAGRFPRMWKV